MTMRRSLLLPVAVASWLVLSHGAPAPLQAQGPRPQAPGGLKRLQLRLDAASGTIVPGQPSYQQLDDDPREFRPGAEWEVQGRLQALQQLQQMQKNAQKLARDPDLVNKLRGFRPEEIEQLRKKLQSGEQLNPSPQMQELLKKLTEGRPPQEIPKESLEALRKLVDKPAPAPTDVPTPPAPNSNTPAPAPDTTSPGSAAPAQAPSEWDQLQGDAADWVRNNLSEAGGDLASAIERWQSPRDAQAMRDLFSGKNVAEGGLRYRLAEQAQGLSGHLPRLHLRMPQAGNALGPFRSLWTHVEPPRLGGFSSTAGHGGASSAAGDWTFAVLFGLLGVLLLLLLGRQVQLHRAGLGAHEREALGPWPVAPGAVSTRQQLVRAFDYLALLILGREARSCHHLDVAERLGRSGGDLAHEQAAESLARLYEQARYAPPSEALGPDELAAARRHLCFLAGVNPS